LQHELLEQEEGEEADQHGDHHGRRAAAFERVRQQFEEDGAEQRPDGERHEARYPRRAEAERGTGGDRRKNAAGECGDDDLQQDHRRAPSRKTNAAMRPLVPSRRYEKKRPRSLNVQRSPPSIAATPARARRIRASASRSACHLPGDFCRNAVRAAASRPTNASYTSEPTSNAMRPMAGPSHATIRAGLQCIAAIVLSRTPAASPRQPACATATTDASRSAKSTGM